MAETRNVTSESLNGGQFSLSTQLMKLNNLSKKTAYR